MAHNIEGFEEYFAFIRTEPIYFKYVGKVALKNKFKITAETEKAILVREKIQTDKEMYSTNPYWIPKSKLISLTKLKIEE